MKRTLILFFLLSGFCLAQSNNGFSDDFNDGLDNWVISSQGNNCTWENYYPPYPGPYSIPNAQGGIMAADADQCGDPLNTTAVLDTIIDMSGYFCQLDISWDNDWNVTDGDDSAFVEISTDFGNTWEVLWEKDGISARTSTEQLLYDEYQLTDIDFAMIRFRTVQHGPGSWWAIDNFNVLVFVVLEIPATPTNLTAQMSGSNSDVLLNWDFTTTPSYEIGFQITRKLGEPWPYNDYEILDSLDITARSYIDTTAQDNLQYSYRIRAYSYQFISYFSEAAVIVTPVEFISFSACANGTDVILNWSTATETNNRGFIIERNAGEGFTGVGFIAGSGTTTRQQSYLFTDKNVSAGTYHYRLKQVDFDGSYQYSKEVEVDLNTPLEFSLEQNYPNPFNPTTKIKWQISVGGQQTLKVFDILGEEIATLVDEYRPAGKYAVEFSAENLPGGVYMYQLKSGSFVQTKKMILLK